MSSFEMPGTPHISGRFRLLSESELMSPAKCVFCGIIPSAAPDKFASGMSSAQELKETLKDENDNPIYDEDNAPIIIDGRLDFEYYGSVYFCKNCTLEMAAMYGAIPVEKFEGLVLELKSTYGELQEALVRIQELEETRDNLSRELLRVSVDSTGSVVLSNPKITEATPSNPPEYEGVRDNISKASNSGEGSGDSKTNESSDSERSDDLSSLTGLADLGI